MAPTCFGLRPSSGSLQLSLAKVILILKHSVRLGRYLLCRCFLINVHLLVNELCESVNHFISQDILLRPGRNK